MFNTLVGRYLPSARVLYTFTAGLAATLAFLGSPVAHWLGHPMRGPLDVLGEIFAYLGAPTGWISDAAHWVSAHGQGVTSAGIVLCVAGVLSSGWSHTYQSGAGSAAALGAAMILQPHTGWLIWVSIIASMVLGAGIAAWIRALAGGDPFTLWSNSVIDLLMGAFGVITPGIWLLGVDRK